MFLADIALLCIARPELSGRLNITPVEIAVTSAGNRRRERSFAIGSSSDGLCLRVAPGRGSIRLRYPYPYGGPGEPVRWWTVHRRVTLRPGRNDFILDLVADLDTDAPHWTETGWRRMWQILPGRRPSSGYFISRSSRDMAERRLSRRRGRH